MDWFNIRRNFDEFEPKNSVTYQFFNEKNMAI